MSFVTSLTAKNKKQFRIVFLGDMGVGKTSLIEKFTMGKFDESQSVHSSSLSPQLESISASVTLP